MAVESKSIINIWHKLKLVIPAGAYSISIGKCNKEFNNILFEEYSYLNNYVFIFRIIERGPPYFAGLIRVYPEMKFWPIVNEIIIKIFLYKQK